MVRKLRNLMGRVEVRVLVLLACGIVLTSLALVFAQTLKSSSVELPFPTVSTWDDLAKQYLIFREQNYALVPPTWSPDISLDESALEALQKDPDWYMNFDAGVYVFDEQSPLAELVKSGAQVVFYEDMAKQEVLVLSVLEKEGEEPREEIVYRSPDWPELQKGEDEGAYLWRELSKRRIAWQITLKSKAQAEEDLAAQSAEESAAKAKGSGQSGGMRLMGMEELTNHLWVSIDGPAQGLSDIEIAAHIPDGFTNRIEVFTCTNLLDFWWTLAATNILTEGTDTVYWTYETTEEETGPVFFVVGNADSDSDGDGLTDAREKFLYHTSPTNADTDADDMPDGWEVQYGLSPTDAADAEEDADGDGYMNVYEYKHGSDPLSTNSVPAPDLVVTNGGATIQDMIDSVTNDYAVIRVEPGTYTGPGNYSIDLWGRRMMLVSSQGPEATIIDVRTNDLGFLFWSGESRRSVLSGFTVLHAGSGGILCWESWTWGASSPTIQNCIISQCGASGSDGGLKCWGVCNPRVRSCVFMDNKATDFGGAVYCDDGSAPELQNCTIVRNAGAGIYCEPSAAATVRNCIVFGNTPTNWVGAEACEVTYSCLGEPVDGEGNITNEPAVAAWGFRLLSNSPCIDAGLDVGAPLRDVDGDARSFCPGRTNAVSAVDMGADEFQDADGDGMADSWEIAHGLDPQQNDALADADSDGVGNLEEYVLGSNPDAADTDSDGLTDDEEIQHQTNPRDDDSDHDELADGAEIQNGTDPLDPDSDHDNLTDGWEVRNGTNPLDSDSDHDLIPDDWEVQYGLNPNLNDATNDPDGDGLTNLQEYQHGTNPWDWDCDNDKLPDGWEVQYGMNPWIFDDITNVDADADGLVTLDEYRFVTNPTNADTDGDGVIDGTEAPHSPGSNPNDASDQGDPANCVTLSLTVGDPSPSWSERWRFELSTGGKVVVQHVNKDFGTPGTHEYALVKGKTYEGKLVWVDSNWSELDYDWQALVNGSTATGWCAGLYGTGLFKVTDDDGLLTTLTHGESTNLTIGRKIYIDVSTNVLSVQLDHDVWWFNGENPTGGYNIAATLAVSPLTTGTFKWDVISGSDKVDLNNGGADADSITATDDNTVTVKSTAPSAGAATVTKDVTVRLTYNGVAVCTYDLAVFSPDHLVHLGDIDQTNGTSFTSLICYEICDQFDDLLPYDVPWNEDIDGNGVASDAATVEAAAISDWTVANGRPEDENWGWGAEGSVVTPPGAATDGISRGAPPGRVPSPRNPQSPLGSDKIDHSPAGGWYVGSLTPGEGVRVIDVVWQMYRDHARHE